MIAARMLGCLGSIRKICKPRFKNYVQSIRKSSHGHEEVVHYREFHKGPEARSHEIAADALGAFLWWWMLWHIFTQPEMLFGEYPELDSSKWTDEELGIPPDEE